MKAKIALWLLGFWAMGTVAIALTATESFGVVDELLSGSPNAIFTSRVEELGPPAAREFLRYLSSEVNRKLFQIWGWAQIPLGVLVLWLVGSGGPRSARNLVAAMLGLAFVLAFGLTPPIVDIGRSLDFVPREPPPPELGTFGLLHAAYSGAEFLKLGIGLVAAWLLVRPPRPTG